MPYHKIGKNLPMLEMVGDTKVAECQGTVANSELGEIEISGPIIKTNVHAVFAANSADPQDFLWFGPTELPEALAWHSS